MPQTALFSAGAAAGLVGLVLFVLETARALSDNTLGTVASVLLWVGVGLIALAALLLLLAVLRATGDAGGPGSPGSDGGQPADG